MHPLNRIIKMLSYFCIFFIFSFCIANDQSSKIEQAILDAKKIAIVQTDVLLDGGSFLLQFKLDDKGNLFIKMQNRMFPPYDKKDQVITLSLKSNGKEYSELKSHSKIEQEILKLLNASIDNTNDPWLKGDIKNAIALIENRKMEWISPKKWSPHKAGRLYWPHPKGAISLKNKIKEVESRISDAKNKIEDAKNRGDNDELKRLEKQVETLLFELNILKENKK